MGLRPRAREARVELRYDFRSDDQKHNAQIFEHNLSKPNATCVVKNVSGFLVFLRRHNQTVPVASTVFVKYRRQKRAEAAKVNVGGNVPIRFYPLILAVFLLDLEALRNNFYLGNLELLFFSIKEIKKKILRAMVKLTALSKTRDRTLKLKSLETQKPWIEIH